MTARSTTDINGLRFSGGWPQDCAPRFSNELCMIEFMLVYEQTGSHNSSITPALVTFWMFILSCQTSGDGGYLEHLKALLP
jgi:hypothetical protein